MKLRNKKTGEIQHAYPVIRICDGKTDICFASLAELNEEWEDYKPTEPLIKDEKVRKAVRAWAEANGIERVWHEYSSCWLRGNGLKIELENDEVVELQQGNYAIAELCGEPVERDFEETRPTGSEE